MVDWLVLLVPSSSSLTMPECVCAGNWFAFPPAFNRVCMHSVSFRGSLCFYPMYGLVLEASGSARWREMEGVIGEALLMPHRLSSCW